MVICLEFPKGKQKEFLLKVKEKENCSWDKIAVKINIHRQTIFIYLKETSRISEQNFRKLCKISKLNKDKFDFKKVNVRNEEVEIKLPKLSKNLSEFIGILAGDGHISKKKPYEVCVVGHNVLDKYLLEDHLYNLIKNLFGVEPIKLYQKNIVKIRVYSKKLRKFLMNKYRLPNGKKKGRLKIPTEIENNPIYLKSYLRGLFDTDGSFHRHHKNTGCVEFISRDMNFLNEVNGALRTLKFKTSISGKNLYIYKQSEIKRFFKEVGSKNLKHIIKYEKFIKEGKVPLNKEIIDIMRQ